MELVEMRYFHKCLKSLVPGAGVEPARGIASRDFKSLMSTSSITQAQPNINKSESRSFGRSCQLLGGDVGCEMC